MKDHSPLIVICCAQEDYDFANRICSAIAHVMRSMIAGANVAEKDGWTASGQEMLSTCDAVVVIYSQHANRCPSVSAGLGAAALRNVPILPIRIDATRMSPDLEYFLSAYHWMDATRGLTDDALREIVNRLQTLATQAYRVAKSETGDNVLRKHRSERRATLLTTILLIVCVALATGAVFTLTLREDRIQSPERRARVTSDLSPPQRPVAQQEAVFTPQWKTEDYQGFLQLRDGVTMEFVWCPPGTFIMGIEDNIEVTLSSGFWLGKYEVTRDEWRAVTGDTEFDADGDGRLPMSNVSWHDCQEFFRIVNGGEDGPFRLPTDTEWEYACRAGTRSVYFFGYVDARDSLDWYAWYVKNSARELHPVGMKAPNPWSLFDMYGNVEEWCDYYGSSSSEARVRGGCYKSSASDCTSFSGYVTKKRDRFYHTVGFRVCGSLSAENLVSTRRIPRNNRTSPNSPVSGTLWGVPAPAPRVSR